MSTEKAGTLAQYGVPLAEGGFEVIWIPKGLKRPVEDKWQSMHTDVQTIRKHAANGKADFNVGIRTRYTPAIDLDILDEEMADTLEEWCLENLGEAPVRVGRWPKRLLVYATDAPRRKMQIEFFDANGERNKIEILGEGQQFVAYGIHPDTKKPYSWTSAKDLTKYETLDLELLDWDRINELFTLFRRLAEKKGWKAGVDSSRTGSNRRRSASEGEGGYGDIGEVQTRGRFTLTELRAFLAVLEPDEGGYDRWLQVGQALHNATDGSDEGRDLWDEWSVASNAYDSDEIEKKWETFGIGGHSQVITGRTLSMWAQERRVVVEAKTYDEIVEEISQTKTVVALTGPVLKSIAKDITSPALHDSLVAAIVKRSKELEAKVSTPTVRKMLAKEVRKVSRNDETVLPDWCENYIFVKQDNVYYDTVTRLSCDKEGFNAEFNRKIPRGDEPTSAAKTVLDEYGMKIVDTYTYLPGHPLFVDSAGVRCVNTYNDRSVPKMPKKASEDDKKAVARVQAHFKMLFPDERERKLLISYFAYTVQHLDRRVRWAPLIYGAQGAGKTFFHQMMTAILGKENTLSVNARQLKQQFTSWAEGRKMVTFEEIRVKGENRFEMIDALKPFITNDDVDVRRMHTDIYKVPNVTCFLLFTNHPDAIPVQDSDRRWLILATSLVSAAQMKAFNEQNPTYFIELFDTLKHHAGAILKWLKQYTLHPEFKPEGNAPETDAKILMRDVSRGDASDELENLLDAGPRWDVCNDLVCIHSIKTFLTAQSGGHPMDDEEPEYRMILPHDRVIASNLLQLGFHPVGRARTERGSRGKQPVQRLFYSKRPEIFDSKDLQNAIFKHRDMYGKDEFGL